LGIVLGLAVAGRAEPSRHPTYGGTLRVEIGAAVNSLDPAVPPANLAEAAAKEKISALTYDHRNPDGAFAGVAGSGPFRVGDWDPGKRAILAANEGFHGGRPFVDSIEIQMGRSARDRLLDLELGKADFVEIPPEEARRSAERGVRVNTSQTDELLVLVFLVGRRAADDARVREALARSIDRPAIVNFILQKEGDPAGGLLPQWSSGTAFLFSTAADVPGARDLWAQIGRSPKIVLGYDASDSLEQAVAERIVVNAREAGLAVSTDAITGAGSPASVNAGARIVRLRMPSPHPREALTYFISLLGPLAGIEAVLLPANASAEQIYERERAILSSYRIVPLVWFPQVYGLSARVRDWKPPLAGESWPFADVWLEGSPQ
jgi:ABC-type transport system substrate-binding protein